uniref:GK21618 n=1 Tax=Drosophila willistoni TaxID=7260 RepID=B4MPE0_DROWI
MAEDPINQQAFAQDVAAAAEAGGPAGFAGAGMGGPGSPDFKMPSAEEIWKIVEGMDGITDAEREELRENIFNPKSPEDILRPYNGGAGGLPHRLGHSSSEYWVFFVMLALILLVFGKDISKMLTKSFSKLKFFKLSFSLESLQIVYSKI